MPLAARFRKRLAIGFEVGSTKLRHDMTAWRKNFHPVLNFFPLYKIFRALDCQTRMILP
jgi:hypothetical protein